MEGVLSRLLMLPDQVRIDLHVLPCSPDFGLELSILVLGRADDLIDLGSVKVRTLSSRRYPGEELVQLLRLVVIEHVLLLGLVLILSGEVGHQLLISNVVEYLLLDKALVLVLNVLDDGIHLRGIWVLNSVVVQGFADESDSELVDFGPQLESTFVRSEIVLDRRVLAAPGQHSGHRWIQVSQILFNAELSGVVDVWVLRLQGLVVHFGLYDVWLAGILGFHFFEPLSMKDLADFGSLLAPLLELLVDLTCECV